MPTRDHIDPKKVVINLDEIFEASKRAQENRDAREAIKNFVDEMKEEIIPEAEHVVSSLIPAYAHKNEIETAKMIWRCFEQVAALDDPRVNAIIAGEIEKLNKKKGKK